MTQFIEADKPEMDHSDSEIAVAEHSKLLSAISQLDNKQRVKPPSRKEPTLQVSEFHLVQSGEGRGNAVHLLDLAKALKTKSSHVEISRKLKTIRRKGRTLPKPLEKPVAERIQRSVGFTKVKKQVARWEPIVQKNRIADHLSFPLSQGRVSADASKEFFSRFKTQSPLEAQVAEILSQSNCAQEDKEIAEEESSLSLEQIIERRKQMAKLRAQQSYEAAKARRQGKIKSKKYHRVLRRERLRKQLKDFETLQKTDPEAALEQLKLIERTRAKERMTLRHRNTGKWARNLAIRAKYDHQSRQVLAEQLTISRDLTKKVQSQTDSSEEDDETGNSLTKKLQPQTGSSEEEEGGYSVPSAGVETKSDNRWITPDPEVLDFVSKYQKYKDKHNKELQDKNKKVLELSKSKVESKSNDSDSGQHSVESLSDSEQIKEKTSSPQDDLEDVGENGEVNSSIVDKCTEETNIKTANHVRRKSKPTPTNISVGNNSEKGTSVVKNVSRKNEQQSITRKGSLESISMNSSMEIMDEHSLGNETTVKATTSWIVTPIKVTNKNNNTQENHDVDRPVKNGTHRINRKERIARKRHAIDEMDPDNRNGTVFSDVSFDTKRNGTEILTGKNVKVDDMFDELEHRMKQKVSKKLSELKSNIKCNDSKHEEHQQKEMEEEETEEGPSLAMKVKAKRPQEDVQLMEECRQGNVTSSVPVVPVIATPNKDILEKKKENLYSNEVVNVKPKFLRTQFPDTVTGGDEGVDNEEVEDSLQMNMIEVYTDDAITAEFVQEKADAAEKSKPKDIDVSLPGWGSWGGKNIKINNRKKRRFIVKFPKAVARKDDNKGHLIINEDKDTKILKHQVSDVPFPFTTVKDFEASIRAPVGNTWVPETAHRKLIEPQVKTKLGTIIHPMDEETLVNKGKKTDIV